MKVVLFIFCVIKYYGEIFYIDMLKNFNKYDKKILNFGD